jgi:hypothetical protein
VYPRDHVVTIGLRNTLCGELAARDSPICAPTHALGRRLRSGESELSAERAYA